MPHEFTDTAGRKWLISVTATAVKRVQEHLDTDLCDVPVSGELFAKLRENDIFLCDVLFVLCMPQAKDHGVTSEQFGEALLGDVITKAETAFWGALSDFFREAKRELLDKMLEGQIQVEKQRLKLLKENLTAEQIEQLIEGDVAELRSELSQHLETLGARSGNSRELSETTQGH